MPIKLTIVILLICLLNPLALGLNQQKRRFSSKYVKPSVGGLFYAADGLDKYDLRALVISYDDQPIEPKANDPDAPTIPGFYPSDNERYDFEHIEVIRKRVYFRTRSVRGISYEFSGTSGKEFIVDFDPSVPVPFIKGTLTKLKNGRAVKRERVKFGHAVIA